METVFVGACLGLLGAILGSFAGAQVWRLRARQLDDDNKRLAELRKVSRARRSPAEQAEYEFLREISGDVSVVERRRLQPLLTETAASDRSRCLSCEHRLAWYDLLPVVSWLSTGGRCRYCQARIGWLELLIEFGLGVFFVLSYLLWPYALDSWLTIAAFVFWLGACVPLAILFAYDQRWYLLPDPPMVVFTGMAAIFAVLRLGTEGVSWVSVGSLMGSIAAISGLYFVLNFVSKGKWVGFGDVVLGIGLGFLLGRWELALLAVVLANFIGTLLVLPGLLRGSVQRTTQIPFGPLLIIGMLLSFFWGELIINWYLGLL